METIKTSGENTSTDNGNNGWSDFPPFMGETAERQPVVRHNEKLQAIYDGKQLPELDEYSLQSLQYMPEEVQIQEKFKAFNLAEESPFLASGQSSYFNEQIDEHGMSGLKLREQDVEDARYVAECFGKKVSFSDDGLDILYTTLPGTTEMNYASQTFPAVIFEDVLQCDEDHRLPFSPKVGESEVNYWNRVLAGKIAVAENFPSNRVDEAKRRGARLISNFCTGKNRVYLIPIKNVLDNKASFGDAMGLRGGELEDGETAESAMGKLLSLQELSDLYGRDPNNVSELYGDANFSSEFGVAIYGKVPLEDVQYIEVERGYDTMQRKARQAGFSGGDAIDLSMQPEWQ